MQQLWAPGGLAASCLAQASCANSASKHLELAEGSQNLCHAVRRLMENHYTYSSATQVQYMGAVAAVQ